MNAKLLAAAGIVFVVIARPMTGHAVTLQVNCDNRSSKLPTIGAALKIVSGSIGNREPASGSVRFTGTTALRSRTIPVRVFS